MLSVLAQAAFREAGHIGIGVARRRPAATRARTQRLQAEPCRRVGRWREYRYGKLGLRQRRGGCRCRGYCRRDGGRRRGGCCRGGAGDAGVSLTMKAELPTRPERGALRAASCCSVVAAGRAACGAVLALPGLAPPGFEPPGLEPRDGRQPPSPAAAAMRRGRRSTGCAADGCAATAAICAEVAAGAAEAAAKPRLPVLAAQSSSPQATAARPRRRPASARRLRDQLQRSRAVVDRPD